MFPLVNNSCGDSRLGCPASAKRGGSPILRPIRSDLRTRLLRRAIIPASAATWTVQRAAHAPGQRCSSPVSGEASDEARIPDRHMARPPTHLQLQRLHEDLVRPGGVSFETTPGKYPLELTGQPAAGKAPLTFTRTFAVAHFQYPQDQGGAHRRKEIHRAQSRAASANRRRREDQAGLSESRDTRPRVGRQLRRPRRCRHLRRLRFAAHLQRQSAARAPGTRFPCPHRNSGRRHECRHRAAGALSLFRRQLRRHRPRPGTC